MLGLVLVRLISLEKHYEESAGVAGDVEECPEMRRSIDHPLPLWKLEEVSSFYTYRTLYVRSCGVQSTKYKILFL